MIYFTFVCIYLTIFVQHKTFLAFFRGFCEIEQQANDVAMLYGGLPYQKSIAAALLVQKMKNKKKNIENC